MRKVDLLINKNKSIRDTRTSETRAPYLCNNFKSEMLENIDNNILNNTNSSVTKGGTSKKRKTSEDLESKQLKSLKHDYCSDVYVQNMEKQTNVVKKDTFKHLPSSSSDTFDGDSNNLMKTKFKADNNDKKNMMSNCCKSKEIVTDENTTLQDKDKLNKQVPVAEFKVCPTEKSADDIIPLSNSDFKMCFPEDLSDCFIEEWSTGSQIDFSSLQRCKVVDIKRERSTLVLTVKSDKLKMDDTIILCSGFWKDARIEKDNIIAVQARKDDGQWVVDNSNGFLVVHPDLLISGTTVVGGLFCNRKAVLAERFRKMEGLPYQKGDSTALIIGSLTHQLFQTAIRDDIRELIDVKKLMDQILHSRATSSMLYESQITFDTCKEQMLQYVPKIYEFIQHYLNDKRQESISSMKKNFKGTITQIHDIEENMWVPQLGVKGKVDVTVGVKINSKRKIIPLEIKSGKPSFSLEHRGQIILYIMMMALMGQNTDTGLLLYLRDNSIQEISAGHPEKRDLILLRNTLAHYLVLKPADKLTDLKSDLQRIELPEPINHPTACQKCPYNTVCCAYLSKESKVQLSEWHPLRALSKQILEKIKPTHIDYVLQWVSLLQMEEVAHNSDNLLRNLWTSIPEEREYNGHCICYLKVVGKVSKIDNQYRHTFMRSQEHIDARGNKIPHSEFSEKEYVLVSTQTKVNISAGIIVQIEEDSLTVLLDRNVTGYHINAFFHIDKYSSFSFLPFNLANVGGLMGNDEICEKLRDIVIDRKPATFANGVPQSVVRQMCAKLIKELNENQQRAVLKAMISNDYILIKGMAGTGKTQTLVALIQLLHEGGKSILVSAHTNSAVDNILLKLLDKGIDFLRLGSSIHPALKHKGEGEATSHCHSPDSLDAVYSSKNVIGVTCYGAHHALLAKRTFDVCLVDECAQTLQPTVLRPLYSARKFVLVGDPEQLPPIIRSKQARKWGADESLFARLDSENNTVTLTKQYRMNKKIMYLANKLTYSDKLEAGSSNVANATFRAPNFEEALVKQSPWLRKALSQDINDSVIVIDTLCTRRLRRSFDFGPKYPETDQVNSNIWEAAIVSKLMIILEKMGVKHRDIGVIAPYRAQVHLLRIIAQKDIEINTIDQYQGRDKEVIIYTCAKSLTKDMLSKINEDHEVLGDHRRLTVAITRAKCKLIIVGDKRTISQYTAFKKLFELVGDENIINVYRDDTEFTWSSVMAAL